ncbi:type II secretion system F family protein [Arthrobacter sp. B0490]|uniref:type II secretion system F family protein n=1 Tax=Arthrobacter sp. B0490 TaxID=2058891 RepID=UPI0015E37465|nr:hypothetical protein [Arthrobacter sp. B0490]
MTGMIVALLLAASGLILISPRPVLQGQARRTPAGGAAGPRPPSAAGRGRGGTPGAGRRPPADLHEVPLFVHQLAGLLRAGRPSQVLWADMERVYADAPTAFARAALPMISTARRAAELGLSVPDALRQAAGAAPDPGVRGQPQARLTRLWIDLSGCLIVAERSGAPLAGILTQYAAQLDADLDGLSARETALAGPRATVVLLAWLPVVGLVLGFALGVNPLEILLGSSLGRIALAAGILLMIVSRFWSRRLVSRAGGGAP